MIPVLFAVLLSPAGQPAQPALTSHVPDAVARHAATLVAAPATRQPLDLTISLPLRNEPELRALIRAVNDPTSPEYRHFLTVAQFADRYGATPADYQALVRFALASNLHPRALAANRHVLDVETTVGDAQNAFNVRIGVYRDPQTARTFYAPDREPTLALRVPVLHITGLDNQDVPVSHLVRGDVTSAAAALPTGSGPGGNLIGSDVRAAYYGGTALDGTGESVGLFEFPGYNLSDVDAYFAAVGQKRRVPIVGVSLNGANLACTAPCTDDGEQALDIEEAISMAPGLKQLVVYVGKNAVSIINQMASDDTSKQLSCSWGFKPDPAELDPIFEEFAAQGQNFLVATGDDGYHLKAGGVWPADDQLVVAVGGTDLRTKGPGGTWASETGWRYSGGGPSPDGVPIPYYQKPFVTSDNGGSTTVRNVPDIAGDANTDNYSCYDGTCSTGNGGTSYAAPIWAGYIALANQYAAASNEPPLGFLNFAFYGIGSTSRYPTVFHDIVKGNNGLYSAGAGFDLVTGFGSPNGDALIKALARRD